MADAHRLLELIEMFVIEHGGDLGGWTRLHDGALQLFDGRVTLRAEFSGDEPEGGEGFAHAHVFTTLHDNDEEVLDACLFGIGDDREAALAQAATIWVTGVAGPIRSLLDDLPVCMTCRAGVEGADASRGEVRGDYGLPGLRAFVGPAIMRGIDDDWISESFDDTMPWFRFAAESAAARRVHLAKASVLCQGEAGWRRELEIDGHDVAHHDPDWPESRQGPGPGYLTRFAVFEFPADSPEIARRAELERAIRYFAENFSKHESVDDLMDEMAGRGFDPGLVREVEAVSTIAFGRLVFEGQGVGYSPTIIRACRDGRVLTDIPLMSLPAYSRARAIGAKLRETMPPDEFQALCLYNAESNAILKAIESVGDGVDLSQIRMFPSVVPEHGTDDRTMATALKLLDARIQRRRAGARKPWWKFW